MKISYRTSNHTQFHQRDFREYSFSKVKSIREDFNDMFSAEAEMRRKRGDISLVFCLTYNDEHIRHKYGQNMIDADDLKRFSKSSRFAKMIRRKFGYEMDIVTVGEFGQGGETHNYRGKRGVGQNPHFHGCAFFHEVEKVLSDEEKASIKLNDSCVGIANVLAALLRYEWQGVFDDDAVLYGRCPAARAAGLGYVKLDGALKSSYSGGSYFSKYIGKDIRTIWQDSYFNGFAPLFYTYALDSVGEVFGFKCPYELSLLLDQIFAYEFSVRRVYLGLFPEWFFNIKCHKDFEILAALANSLPFDVVPHLDTLWSSICGTYALFYDDFMEDLNGRYSPKLRKFHGFGYSLIDEQTTDVEKGVYYGDGYMRKLPPSLCRHLYYDFKVCTVPGVTIHGKKVEKKVVKYCLSELGFRYLEYTLKKAYEMDVVIARSLGSPALKKNCEKVAILRNYLLTYDVEKTKFKSNKWLSLLDSPDRALQYAVNCRQLFLPDLHVPEVRCFVNVHDFMKRNRPHLYALFMELDDLHNSMLSNKNFKDQMFVEHWLRVYKSNF